MEPLIFRNERDILTAISRLSARVDQLVLAHNALAIRVKTLEDRGASSSDPTIHSKLDMLLHQQAMLLQQGAQLIMNNAEFAAILDDINVSTNAIAADLTRQSSAITEIDADIDALLTRAPGEPISPQLKARFEQHRDTLRGIQTDLSAKATQLEATAAKSPVATEPPPPPPPPPVEEPPVEQPPVEQPPVEAPPVEQPPADPNPTV